MVRGWMERLGALFDLRALLDDGDGDPAQPQFGGEPEPGGAASGDDDTLLHHEPHSIGQ